MRGLYFYGAILIFILGVFIKYQFFYESGFESNLSEGYFESLGLIIDEPDIRENNVIYKFKPENSDEVIRVFLGPFPQLSYGDRLHLKGNLVKPENFTNESGIEFDYINYLSKDEIYYQLFFPKIDNLETGYKKGLKWYLFKIKNSFSLQLSRIIPSPQAELSNGLLLGSKQALGSDWLYKFRVAGLIHIIVLSGYNITIIAEAIRGIFSFMPKKLSFVITIFSIFSFAILTGASSTIIRASIMVTLVLITKHFNKRYSVNRSLFFVAFLMILFNPKILIFDPGFQLSFVATLGLVHVSPIISRKMTFITERFGIREILSSTLATQITVLPLLIRMTGEVSLVAIFVNVLVLPIVPFVMLMSFITALLSFINIKLALLPGFISYVFLKYIFIVAGYFSSFKYATINLVNLFKIIFNNFPI